MNLHINSYINFEKLFKDLIQEQLETLQDGYYACDWYPKILDFKDKNTKYKPMIAN